MRVAATGWIASAALGAAIAVVAPARAETPGVALSYDVYRSGFNVLSLQLEIGLHPRTYTVVSRLKTAGVVAWLFDWSQVAESAGAVTAAGLVPLRHSAVGLFRGRQRLIEIDYREGRISAVRAEPKASDDDDRDEVSEGSRAEASDPMSSILNLVRSVNAGNGCAGRLPVFDGRRRYDIVFADRGPALIEPSSYSIFSGEAALCAFVFEPVAGHVRRGASEESNARRLQTGRVWLAPVLDGAPSAPVRIELDGGWGMTMVHLIGVQRAAEITPAGVR